MKEDRDDERLRRRETLKGIVKDLHAGVPAEKLRKTFAKLIKDVTPEEIADMENALIAEGFPVEEVQRLCDVHARVFDKALKKAGKPGKVPGHPIHTFVAENREAKAVLKELKRAAKPLDKGAPDAEAVERFAAVLARFKEYEKHYARKENQLFPALEAKGFTGPAKVMWGKHDEVRAMIRGVEADLEASRWTRAAEAVKTLSGAVKKLAFLEENILYPASARKLSSVEWARIKQGEPEIGYAWVTPGVVWDAALAAAAGAKDEGPPPPAAAPTYGTASGPPAETIELSTGRLTPEQIDLMLKRLPVDVTFVDENDRVAYYSDSKERIFPRSPGVIGRAVQNCHPPKSVHVVEEIVRSFKDKTRDVAEFWIQRGGRFIHIRYFPVYDKDGAYRGVIEVSQDVAAIRALQGEKRLLDE
ncbi:MAG: DUF438 domain-containing protein [Candidatus Aminicenantes bacterium]|nr:DUF438 domain-containing protein [Candidatus Aminicenantes bacterium]